MGLTILPVIHNVSNGKLFNCFICSELINTLYIACIGYTRMRICAVKNNNITTVYQSVTGSPHQYDFKLCRFTL